MLVSYENLVLGSIKWTTFSACIITGVQRSEQFRDSKGSNASSSSLNAGSCSNIIFLCHWTIVNTKQNYEIGFIFFTFIKPLISNNVLWTNVVWRLLNTIRQGCFIVSEFRGCPGINAFEFLSPDSTVGVPFQFSVPSNEMLQFLQVVSDKQCAASLRFLTISLYSISGKVYQILLLCIRCNRCCSVRGDRISCEKVE